MKTMLAERIRALVGDGLKIRAVIAAPLASTLVWGMLLPLAFEAPSLAPPIWTLWALTSIYIYWKLVAMIDGDQ